MSSRLIERGAVPQQKVKGWEGRKGKREDRRRGKKKTEGGMREGKRREEKKREKRWENPVITGPSRGTREVTKRSTKSQRLKHFDKIN